jgi:putative SOS response-associated peptidase YedK
MLTSKHVTSGRVIHNAQDDDEWVPSATIITTSDNPDTHEINNGMPVILEKSTWDQW